MLQRDGTNSNKDKGGIQPVGWPADDNPRVIKDTEKGSGKRGKKIRWKHVYAIVGREIRWE